MNLYRTVRYWLALGRDYGYRRQGTHLWRRWRDKDHDRIECVCCCIDCDTEEDYNAPTS